MDHVDWLEQGDIDTLCAALRDQVKPGGRVIWRSASRSPKYAKCIEKAGFDGKSPRHQFLPALAIYAENVRICTDYCFRCAVIRITTSDMYMDRVNMYASFYVGIRQGGVSIEEMVDEKEEEKLPGSPNSVLNAANGLEQLQQ